MSIERSYKSNDRYLSYHFFLTDNKLFTYSPWSRENPFLGPHLSVELSVNGVLVNKRWYMESVLCTETRASNRKKQENKINNLSSYLDIVLL